MTLGKPLSFWLLEHWDLDTGHVECDLRAKDLSETETSFAQLVCAAGPLPVASQALVQEEATVPDGLLRQAENDHDNVDHDVHGAGKWTSISSFPLLEAAATALQDCHSC